MEKKYTASDKKSDNEKSRSQAGEVWRRFRKNKLAMISLAFILLLILIAVFAKWIAPYDYAEQDLLNKFQMPSWQHLMGTDDFGRDLLSRMIYGSRVSLLVAFISVAGSILVATVLGALSGYFGGRFDNIVMRILDVFMAIPGLLLMISLAAALGPGVVNTAIAVSVSGLPGLVRVVRSSVLLLRDQEYIEAAKAFGSGHWTTIRRHIIPNTLAPMIVQATLKFGEAIMAIASLSFLGLGVQPPTPEWGSILANGKEYVRMFWPIVTFPGIVIALTMLAFNLLGDGLRDAMDPRLKR